MFRRFFRRRSASIAAVCVNLPSRHDDVATATLDHTVILRRSDLDALRARIAGDVARTEPDDPRVAELEALLAAKVIELNAVRDAIAAKPAARAKGTPKVAAKPVKLTALEFWSMHGRAVEAIRAEYGDNWITAAPFGETELVSVSHTRARTARGTMLKWSKDHRIPAARYWPGQAFPDGVTVNPDYERENPATADEVRLQQGKAPPVQRSPEWHKAHGYAWNGQYWVSAMALRHDRFMQEVKAHNAAVADVEDLCEAAD